MVVQWSYNDSRIMIVQMVKRSFGIEISSSTSQNNIDCISMFVELKYHSSLVPLAPWCAIIGRSRWYHGDHNRGNDSPGWLYLCTNLWLHQILLVWNHPSYQCHHTNIYRATCHGSTYRILGPKCTISLDPFLCVGCWRRCMGDICIRHYTNTFASLFGFF